MTNFAIITTTGSLGGAALLDGGSGTADEFEFVTCLAAAVTRVFGVTA
ncbi:hypothetical protein ACFVZ8_10490 [Streptomyces sp. NPDC059558]